MNIKPFNIFKNLELFSFLIIFVPISILIGNLWINLTTILIVIFGIKLFYIKIIVFFKENHKIILILCDLYQT